MSELEPEVKVFFKRLATSVFLGLFWLMLAMTFGIFFGFLFINERISIGNVLFYSFFLGSMFLLIRFYIKTWKKSFPHG